MEESDLAVGISRRQGVLDGLREQGDPEVVALQGDYSYESGQRMAEAILAEGPVDAMICATDRLAFGAYLVLERHGLRVSVAGFGGYDESALLKPPLTTLKFDSYAMGYLGAETVLKMIRGEPVPKKQIVDYAFIEGKSVRER